MTEKPLNDFTVRTTIEITVQAESSKAAILAAETMGRDTWSITNYQVECEQCDEIWDAQDTEPKHDCPILKR